MEMATESRLAKFLGGRVGEEHRELAKPLMNNQPSNVHPVPAIVKLVTVVERTHSGFMGFLTVEDDAGERVTFSNLAFVFAYDHVGDRGTLTLVESSDGSA